MVDSSKINNIYLSLGVMALLIFLFIISKEIIMLNEETLVAICFVLFVVVAYKYGSDMAASELDNRAIRIRADLNDYNEKQSHVLELLIKYHEKREALSSDIREASVFSKALITDIIDSKQRSLPGVVLTQIQEKLNLLLLKEAETIRYIQTMSSKWFSQHVLNAFKNTDNNNISSLLKSVIIDEGIDVIQKASRGVVSGQNVSSLREGVVLSKVLNLPKELIIFNILNSRI